MTTHHDTSSPLTALPASPLWLGEPGRGKGVRIKSVPATTSTRDLPDDPALRSALAWVTSLSDVDQISAEDQYRFANDYAAALDEIPPNLDPDRPLPTPADFADENWSDYWSWPLVGSTSA
jgi:hypothetical protein